MQQRPDERLSLPGGVRPACHEKELSTYVDLCQHSPFTDKFSGAAWGNEREYSARLRGHVRHVEKRIGLLTSRIVDKDFEVGLANDCSASFGVEAGSGPPRAPGRSRLAVCSFAWSPRAG
jgi:hypothetical protein